MFYVGDANYVFLPEATNLEDSERQQVTVFLLGPTYSGIIFTSHNPLLGSENCPIHFSCDDDELLPTIVCPNSTIDRPQHDEYY